MQYTIKIDNEGRRFIVASSTKKMFDYLKQNDLNLGDYLCEEPIISIPQKVSEGLNKDTKYDHNNILDLSGALFSKKTWMSIFDDSNNETYKGVLVLDQSSFQDENFDVPEHHKDSLQETINLVDFDHEYVLLGEEETSGIQCEYPVYIEHENFDTQNLLTVYHTMVDNTISIVSSIKYDQEFLVNSLQNKPSVTKVKWFIQNNKTLERTRTQ